MGKRAKREQRRTERQAKALAMAVERRERFRAEVRAQRCPSCGSEAVSRLFYGLPRFSDELRVDLDTELVVLAGCSFTEDDPVWLCRGCKHHWGRLFPEQAPAAEQSASPAEGEKGTGVGGE